MPRHARPGAPLARPGEGRATRTAAGLALAAALLACTSEPPPPLARLTPRLEADAPPAPTTRVVERFDLVAERDEWTFNVPEHTVLQLDEFRPGEPATLIALSADGPATPMRLRREGLYDLSRFNRIEVPVVFEGRGRLGIEFQRAGERVGQTQDVDIAVLQQYTVVTLEVTRELAAAGTADAMVLACRGPTRRLGLNEILLIDEPGAAQLPDPAEGSGLVRVGSESRRAVGLAPGRPVSVDLIGREGALLGFAAGVPESLRRPGAAGHLVVSVVAADQEQVVWRVALADLVAEGEGWRRGEIDTSPWDGEGLVVTFALQDVQRGDVCAVTGPETWTPARDPPTVLLITSDTHRADHVGYADGGVVIETPVLDALARRGLHFSDCLAPVNVTNPSHVALLTGVHAKQTGVLHNFARLSDAAPTLAESFAEQGWVTMAAVTARHLGPERSGLGQGFDRVSWPPDSGRRPASEAIADAVAWLDEVADRPVFLWLHVFDPHWPYEPPEEVLARYYEPTRDPRDPSLPDHGVELRALEKELRDVRDLDWPKARYKAEITAQDVELAAVLDLPRVAAGVVALVADHGEGLGEHGAWFKHVGLYPGVLQVPLVLAGPGVPVGMGCDVPVSHLDLGRTLLDLAGLSDVPFPGRDLVAVATGAPRLLPRFAIEGYGMSAAVTHEGSHLILHLAEREIPDVLQKREAHEVELYDLATDPECQRNLVEEQPERARKLRARLIQWLGAARDLGWSRATETDAEFVDELEQLGYVAPDETADETDLWIPDDCDWCRRFG